MSAINHHSDIDRMNDDNDDDTDLIIGAVVWREHGPAFTMGKRSVEWDSEIAAAVLVAVMRDIGNRDDIDPDAFQQKVMQTLMSMVAG